MALIQLPALVWRSAYGIYTDTAMLCPTIRYIKWILIPLFMLVFIWHTIILLLPYSTAKERLAFGIYKESELYRLRVTELGKQFAFDTYIQYDRPMFKDKLTWKDKAKAFFIPFSCGVEQDGE